MAKKAKTKSQIVAALAAAVTLLGVSGPELALSPAFAAGQDGLPTTATPAGSPTASSSPVTATVTSPTSAAGASSATSTGAPASGLEVPGVPAARPAEAPSKSPAFTPNITKVSCEAGTVQEFKFANGLKVLMLEDHSFPVFTCMTFYRVGSRNENLGETGLSHLVEHLLFQKVGKFRKGEIGATIARNGGMFNGFTSDDFTVFFETMAASKLDLALQIEAERMKAGTLPADEVQAEVKRIGQELDQEAKDSANILVKEVRAAAFQRHPYKNPTVGWRTDVEKLTVEDARRHYKEYYQPGNATLILVGDFNSQAAVASAKKFFGGIASGESPRAVRVVEPQQKAERRVLMKSNAASDVVSLAYHSPAFLDGDTAAMAVLEKVLLSGVGGRLKSKLVEGKVCTGARCSFEVKRDPGLFTVNLTGCAGVPAQKIVESFDAVLDQLKSSPISDNELRRARNHAEYYFQTERDGPYHTAFQLGYFDTLDNWQSSFSAYSRIAAVSSADVQRVAKKYFGSENRVVGILAGSSTKAAAAKKAAEAKSKEQDKDKSKKKETDKEKNSKDKGHGKKQSDSGKEDSASKKKPSHGHHRTASINKSLALPLAAYKESDSAPATPVQRPRQLAQKAGPASSSTAGAAGTVTAKVQQATLQNGLKIGVLETKLSPMVQIVGAVKAGEAYEPVGKRGAALVLAGAMNLGSEKYSRNQAVSLQDAMGIPPQSMIKFEAGPQWINFQSRCFARDTMDILGILSSELRDPIVDDDRFERGKQNCIEHFKRSPDHVKARVDRALLRGLIAPNTSFYPLDPSDKIKFVNALKASDVGEFQSQAVNPDAATIVFVGDISLKQAVDFCERAFGDWNGKSHAKKAMVQPNPRRLLKSSIIVDKREDTMVTIGKLVDAGLGSPDYPLLLIADCALTNHPIISRFAQKISGELSLSSSLSLEDLASDVDSLPGTTLWTVDIPVVSNLMPEAVRTIQNELKKFARSGMTPQEFNEVRLYLNGALPVRWLSSSPLVARTSLDALMLDNQADPLPELLNGIRLANTETVNRFIKVSFKPDRSSLVMAGTKETVSQVHGMKRDEQAGDEGAGPGSSSQPGARSGGTGGATTSTSVAKPAATGGATTTTPKKVVTPNH